MDIKLTESKDVKELTFKDLNDGEYFMTVTEKYIYRKVPITRKGITNSFRLNGSNDIIKGRINLNTAVIRVKVKEIIYTKGNK